MKRNRLKGRSIRTKILVKYFISLMAAFVIWCFLIFIFSDSISGLLSTVKSAFFDFLPLYNAETYLFLYLLAGLILYLLFAVIFTFIYLSRTAGLIDKSYNALSDVLNENYETPQMPKVIRNKHSAVENSIHTALRYREYIAQEAEQRKNDLVVYLAHDLKTPLTSIVGYLTLLQEAPELPAEYRAKYTDITLEKAYRLEQLINEFFDITRFNLQTIVIENNHINLSVMLRQIAEEFYPVLKDKNLICTVNTQDDINITGDADKLSRVFDNLMRNAASYSYPQSRISISAYIQNNEAVIHIRNHGDKIPKEKLDMIFEKFFRADTSRTSSTGGAGLGLAIAKQITQLHGGSITAQSDDVFTTFTVKLPIK